MHQLRSLSLLGAELRTVRREARWTQPALAARTDITVPTVRQAERGRGDLAGFLVLAAALGMEIGGRSLPPGESLGTRLAAMRGRQGWSQRTVAQMAGISATTLAAMENGADCHLTTVIRVGEALGVRLCLVPIGAPLSYWAAAAISSAHHGWATPPDLLDRLYEVIGGRFDLDPCSPRRSGPVKARLHYTVADNGLHLPWRGLVYINPPYGRQISGWVAKARMEVGMGRATSVFALLPARTDTRWWHEHIVGRAYVCLLKGRLSFGDGSLPAPFASALVAWGANKEQHAGLVAAFPDAWHVS